MKLKKDNILITTFYVDYYHGAILYALELGEYFIQLGYNVDIVAVSITDEMKNYAKSKKINIYNIYDLPKKKYSLIWAHHFPTISEIIRQNIIQYEKVIYSSLSPFVPLEAAPFFHNNLDLILANSWETKQRLIKEGVQENKIYIMPNLIPQEFINYKTKKITALKNIAIVSNHVPPELIKLKNTAQDLNIDIYGANYKFELITPEILSKYDVIISIGKTVQYSLAMGIPVYCYDHFGGIGYINLKNIDNEEKYNFSGRATKNKKSTKEINKELKKDFLKTLSEMNKIKKIAIYKYQLSKNINNVLSLIKKLKNTSINKDQTNNLFFTYCQSFIETINPLFKYKNNYNHPIQTLSKQRKKIIIKSILKFFIREDIRKFARKIYNKLKGR